MVYYSVISIDGNDEHGYAYFIIVSYKQVKKQAGSELCIKT